jgi:hypothetical protein
MAVNGGTCKLNVTFTPSTPAAESATITVQVNGLSVPLKVTGTGLAQLSLSPGTLAFGTVGQNVQSVAKTVTLHNNSGGPVSVSASNTGSNLADFAADTSHCNSVANGGTCKLGVTFTPSGLGPESATITVTAGSDTAQLNVTGTGVAQLSLSPSTVGFGALGQGVQSAAKTITVHNYSGGPVSVTPANSGNNPSDFATDASACGSVANGGTCKLSVTFTPSGLGAAITMTAGSNSAQLNVTGTGVAQLSLSSSTLSFGTVGKGVQSVAKTVTVHNYSGLQLAVTTANAGSNPADFATDTSACGAVVNGGTCKLSVTLTPSNLGPESATITVTAGLNSVPLTVTGTGAAQLSLSSSTLSFGTVSQSVTSAPKTVTVHNYSGGPVSVSTGNSGSNPADFAADNSVCGSVANGSTCALSVTFTPSTKAAESATITVTASSNSALLTVSGKGK